MDIQEVGRMLYMLRKEKAMSQEELCRGLCSVATLSRVEKGECRLDIYTFHAILERLGRSAKGIQSVLTLEEFAFLVKRRNIQIALMTKDYDQAQQDIFEYIRCRFSDVSVKNQNLAKANHLQAFIYKKNQCWEKCYECCEAAIEAEVKNSRLILLYQALEMEMECLQNGIKKENERLRQKQYRYLKEVMEEYGQEEVIGEFSYFTDDVLQGKSVIDEVIRYARMRGEYTQEEFSEGICTPETLSRIETARRNPTLKNFYALMQKSGIGMDFYNTEFEVKRFDTMEKIDSLRRISDGND